MPNRVLPVLLALVAMLTVVGASSLAGDMVQPVSAGVPTLRPSATRSPTATVEVTATSTATLPPTVTTGATLPDLTLEVSASPDPVAAGQILSYSVTVLNPSTISTTVQTGLTAQVPSGTKVNALPVGCLEDSALASVRCPVPPLGPGQQQSYSLTFDVSATSGIIFNRFVVDLENVVAESNEFNNLVDRGVSVVPTTQAPTATPIPEATATPPPAPTEAAAPTATPAPQPTPTAPAPSGQLWLETLAPTQTYSVDADPLWVAQAGEYYWVMRQEEGWALAVWEGDPPFWAVWIPIDDRVNLAVLDRAVAGRQAPLWVVVFLPTQAYSVTMTTLWVAQPGEWYRVIQQDPGWVLTIYESDPPEWSVWMQLDDRLEFAVPDVGGPPR